MFKWIRQRNREKRLNKWVYTIRKIFLNDYFPQGDPNYWTEDFHHPGLYGFLRYLYIKQRKIPPAMTLYYLLTDEPNLTRYPDPKLYYQAVMKDASC